MSPLARRLARARRNFALTVGARALLIAFTAGAALLLLLLGADALVALPLGLRQLAMPLAALTAICVLALHGAPRVRDALRSSDEEVALWFERRLQSLRYAPVTAADARTAVDSAALAPVIDAAPLEAELASASRAALRRPGLALAIGLTLLVLIPAGAVARVGAPRPGDSLDRLGASARGAADPLASIVVRV